MRQREVVETVATEDGELELLSFGNGEEWEIRIDRRTLMTSRFNHSELALGELAVSRLAGRTDCAAPRVLVAGLGMGFTLRATLDRLPADAQVVVAEINSVVVDWCRSHLGPLCDNVLEDPRVRAEVVDVSVPISQAAAGDDSQRFDAIVLDLYEGPVSVSAAGEDPLFGRQALVRTLRALRRGGCYAVWSEQADADFERRLKSAGFVFERVRPRNKGPRHFVYLAKAR